jgi:hypothetical protein
MISLLRLLTARAMALKEPYRLFSLLVKLRTDIIQQQLLALLTQASEKLSEFPLLPVGLEIQMYCEY